MNQGLWFHGHPRLALAAMYLLFLAAVEFALRLGLGAELLERTSAYVVADSLVHHDYRPGITFVTRPQAGDTFSPVENRINSLGMRGPEPGPKQQWRVLCLGDSFVQADEVPFDHTFGQLLNQHFAGRLEFLSHGMVSWAPTPQFSWVHHRGLSLDPDEIVLFLCINDFYRAAAFRQADQVYRGQALYQGRVPIGYRLERQPLFRRILGEVALWHLLQRGWRQVRSGLSPSGSAPTIPGEILLLSRPAPTWPAEVRAGVDTTLQVVLDLHRYLRHRGIRLTVALVPLPFAWPDEVVQGKGHPLYGWEPGFSISQEGLEAHVRETAQRNAIPWIDLEGAFKKKKEQEQILLFNEVDGHWNAEGHKVVFQALGDHFASRLFGR